MQILGARAASCCYSVVTGFHEFLTELRRANPNIEMRGV